MRASVNPRPLGGGGSSISVESPPCVQGSRRKTTKKRKTKQTLLILAALDVVGNIWEDLGKSSSHCMGRSSLGGGGIWVHPQQPLGEVVFSHFPPKTSRIWAKSAQRRLRAGH